MISLCDAIHPEKVKASQSKHQGCRLREKQHPELVNLLYIPFVDCYIHLALS